MLTGHKYTSFLKLSWSNCDPLGTTKITQKSLPSVIIESFLFMKCTISLEKIVVSDGPHEAALKRYALHQKAFVESFIPPRVCPDGKQIYEVCGLFSHNYNFIKFVLNYPNIQFT